MTVCELSDKLAEHLLKTILPQVSGWKAQAAIGVAASATGRALMAKKMGPWLEMVSENGQIDIPALKCAAVSAVKTAGKIPVLFDMMTIDAKDVEVFFAALEDAKPAVPVPPVSNR